MNILSRLSLSYIAFALQSSFSWTQIWPFMTGLHTSPSHSLCPSHPMYPALVPCVCTLYGLPLHPFALTLHTSHHTFMHFELLQNNKLLWELLFDVVYCSPQPRLICEPESFPYIQNTQVNLEDTLPKATVKRCVQVEMLRIRYYWSLWRIWTLGVTVLINHATSCEN